LKFLPTININIHSDIQGQLQNYLGRNPAFFRVWKGGKYGKFFPANWGVFTPELGSFLPIPRQNKTPLLKEAEPGGQPLGRAVRSDGQLLKPAILNHQATAINGLFVRIPCCSKGLPHLVTKLNA